LEISSVSAPEYFRWVSNMNRSNVAISSVQHFISVGLIERQCCQYPLYLYTDISVETRLWTVVTWQSLQYSILFQRALLYVIIVNIHCICTLTFPLNTNMNRNDVANSSIQHANSEGLIERQYCQYPLYLNTDISVETPIWIVVTWAYIQYSIVIKRASWTSIMLISTVSEHWHLSLLWHFR
jgi:hypothetical protein